jgi:hypothetical protein
MTSLPAEIETSLIERSCERLVQEFAEALDTQQFDRLRELFVPDATFYRPAEPQVAIHGVDAVIESYRTRLAGYRSQHLCTNVLVRVTSSTTATGTTRILFFAGPEAPGTPPEAGVRITLQIVGGFHDQFERTAQGWRFRERRGRLYLQP